MRFLITLLLLTSLPIASIADSTDDIMRDIKRTEAKVYDIARFRLDAFLHEVNTASNKNKDKSLIIIESNNRFRVVGLDAIPAADMSKERCNATLQSIKDDLTDITLSSIAFPHYSAEFRQRAKYLFTYGVTLTAEDNKDLQIHC